MKRLYLIRHAKSSWKDVDLADIDRPLNKRGERDAPFMGELLKKLQAKPDLIISSPAKRARKTAAIIARQIGYPGDKILIEDSIYALCVPTILNVINDIDDSQDEVMIFGHNPDFTALANYLTNSEVANIPTCGIFCVDFDIQSWKEVKKGNGSVSFFEYPKKHVS